MNKLPVVVVDNKKQHIIDENNHFFFGNYLFKTCFTFLQYYYKEKIMTDFSL